MKSGAGCVAFSFQTVGRQNKGGSAWRGYLAGFRYFCSLVPSSVRLAVVGAVSPQRLPAIAAAAGERPLTLVDTASFVSARRGLLVFSSRAKDAPIEGRDMPLDRLFFENVRRVAGFWKTLLNSKK